MHRVRLGKHGFFDPFASIDRALDADQLRAALAREVSRAEAEARGDGPTARMVNAIARALAERAPQLSIYDQFEGFVTLADARDATRIELDLHRAIEATRDKPATTVDGVARRYLSMLPFATFEPEPFETLRPRLLPRIVRSDLISDLLTAGKSALFALPLVGELSIAIVVEEQGRARYLRRAEAQAFDVESHALLAVALQNLETLSQGVRLMPAAGTKGLLMARTGDGRDSARVLLPALYSHLSASLGSQLCLGIPHRDTFIVCNACDESAMQALALRIAEDAARAPHRLTSQLFSLIPSGLSAHR